MRRLGWILAVLAIGGAFAALPSPATSQEEPPATTPVVETPPAIRFVRLHAFKRSVKLRRRAVLADWGVENPTPDIAAENVETCVRFPAGFRISFGPGNRQDHVRVLNSRSMCRHLGRLHSNSDSETLVEGYAPRKPGNYKVRFTATSDNAPAISKTVTLRVLRRCSAKQCPGFST